MGQMKWKYMDEMQKIYGPLHASKYPRDWAPADIHEWERERRETTQ